MFANLSNYCFALQLKLAQEAEASTNLYKELKVALKAKAVEHQMREAKALGIQIDSNDMQTIDCAHNEEQSDSINKRVNCVNRNDVSQCDNGVEKTKIISNYNAFESDNRLIFVSQIANIAAERGRLIGVSADSECFGDDSDCDSDSSHQTQNA